MAKKTRENQFDMQATMQWASWCPVHNGAPPVYYTMGYKCAKCSRYVCAMCYYPTSKGNRCGFCLGDIPENEKAGLKPLYDPSSLSQSRKNYAAIGLVLMAVLFALSALSFLFPELGRMFSENALYILPAFAILIFGNIIYFYFKFRKEGK